ncbi:MAG: ATP12 family chaperone protein [Geminicoccaceae bacterium]
MKRFYKKVSVDEADGAYRVLLDGRPLKTPAKTSLALPVKGLAEALAVEWNEQEKKIEPTAMPITRLAATAMDRMPELREAALHEITDYTGTDLLCYRAPKPDELVRRQHDVWQPVLDWMKKRYGISFEVTGSLLPAPQPKATIDGIRQLVEEVDDWPLVGLHAATTGLGSVVLAMALWHGEIDATAAADASLLDELFEIEQWGQERDASRRHDVLRRDIRGIAVFLEQLPPDELGHDRTTS